MTKIVVNFPDEHLLYYYETLANNIQDCETKLCHESSTALNILNGPNQKCSLLITSFETENSETLIKSCLNATPSIPVVLCCFEENLKSAKRIYKSETLFHYSVHGESADKLLQVIEKLINVNLRAKQPREYCKVNISFFHSTNEVFCDVYIKISDGKFVKIFHRYENIDHEELARFERKNVRYFYVRQRDFQVINKQLVKSLRNLFENHDSPSNALTITGGSQLALSFPIQLQESVGETIQKVGLNEEALEMTNYAINTTMDLLGANSEVMDILKQSLKRQNYASEHSFILSYLACATVKETAWASEEANLNLTVASFFHDISFTEPEFAQVQEIGSTEYNTLGFQEQEQVSQHIQKAIDTVKSIEGLPQDTTLIISQHHEKYDGSGFPKGLSAIRISPLSAVFNVCHELAQFIYETGAGPEQIREFIRSRSKVYTDGNYKLVIQALRKVFPQSAQLNEETKKEIA